MKCIPIVYPLCEFCLLWIKFGFFRKWVLHTDNIGQDLIKQRHITNRTSLHIYLYQTQQVIALYLNITCHTSNTCIELLTIPVLVVPHQSPSYQMFFWICCRSVINCKLQSRAEPTVNLCIVDAQICEVPYILSALFIKTTWQIHGQFMPHSSTLSQLQMIIHSQMWL